MFGIRFDPKQFNPVNYGLYYNEIKKRFPHASGKVPIPSGQDRINQLNFEQLPRVWYESEDSIIEIAWDVAEFYFYVEINETNEIYWLLKTKSTGALNEGEGDLDNQFESVINSLLKAK